MQTINMLGRQSQTVQTKYALQTITDWSHKMLSRQSQPPIPNGKILISDSGTVGPQYLKLRNKLLISRIVPQMQYFGIK